MQIAFLQESINDDTDYAQFHLSLADGLNKHKHQVEIFQSSSASWPQLEYLGRICRAFSLSKHWDKITKYPFIYGSPMTIIPFLNAPVTPVIAFHSVAEALRRSIIQPDYGEEANILKKYLEEARISGVSVDESIEDHNRLSKEAEEAVSQSNFPIIASTRSVKEDLIKYYNVRPDRITIINYGVDSSWFEPPTNRFEYDDLFREIDSSEPMLIYYVKLRRGLDDFLTQGVDRILETFQRIRELQKLIILNTDDPSYRKLFAKKGALIIENPPINQLPHLFQRGGMFVQTARYEARTLPLMQAMASGLPIISYPIGLAEDVVEIGKNGFLVQNLIQLVAKVDFLRNNISKAEEYGKNAAKTARAKFSLAKSIDQYEKYFSGF